MKCETCNKELTQEQLKWENEYGNDLCYCRIYKLITDLKDKINELEERVGLN